MKTGRALLATALGNALVAVLAVLWAYASYKYNWLNVGGGHGDLDFWDSMSEVVPYCALLAWLALVVGVVAARRRISLTPGSQSLAIVLSLAAGPAVWCLSDWYFHIGFLTPPV